jgi:hypothetical protein
VADQGIVVLGIPIPSSSPAFLSVVTVHVAAGLVCTVAGLVAMLSPKRAGRHPASGTVYYWGLVVVFLTMAALSILRWPANTHLLILGILSFGAGAVGRLARRRLWRGWLRVHVTGMAISYILLLTAFYVDNGPHLPPLEVSAAGRVLGRSRPRRDPDPGLGAPETHEHAKLQFTGTAPWHPLNQPLVVRLSAALARWGIPRALRFRRFPGYFYRTMSP